MIKTAPAAVCSQHPPCRGAGRQGLRSPQGTEGRAALSQKVAALGSGAQSVFVHLRPPGQEGGGEAERGWVQGESSGPRPRSHASHCVTEGVSCYLHRRWDLCALPDLLFQHVPACNPLCDMEGGERDRKITDSGSWGKWVKSGPDAPGS